MEQQGDRLPGPEHECIHREEHDDTVPFEGLGRVEERGAHDEGSERPVRRHIHAQGHHLQSRLTPRRHEVRQPEALARVLRDHTEGGDGVDCQHDLAFVGRPLRLSAHPAQRVEGDPDVRLADVQPPQLRAVVDISLASAVHVRHAESRQPDTLGEAGAQGLARGTLRQHVHLHDDLGKPLVRQRGAALVAELAEQSAHLLVRLGGPHRHADDLPQLRVWRGEGYGLEDAGVADGVLDLEGGDLLAATQDELLLPTAQREVALIVQSAAVAGVEPAGRVEGPIVWVLLHVLSNLVAFRHIPAADAHLPMLVHFHLRPRRGAHAGEAHMGSALVRAHGHSLGHAVCGDDFAAEGEGHVLRHRGQQSRGRVANELEAARVERPVFLPHHHDVDRRAGVVPRRLQRLQEAQGLGAAEDGGADHGGRSRCRGEDVARDASDVEQRHDVQAAVSGL
mmetsp:Transcript_56561/g.183885  ORF Transcript_56561/g.183885 Transcript_56561/m.183885 type:complete len:451 (+) Transcript_56561:1114-2466(+)